MALGKSNEAYEKEIASLKEQFKRAEKEIECLRKQIEEKKTKGQKQVPFVMNGSACDHSRRLDFPAVCRCTSMGHCPFHLPSCCQNTSLLCRRSTIQENDGPEDVLIYNHNKTVFDSPCLLLDSPHTVRLNQSAPSYQRTHAQRQPVAALSANRLATSSPPPCLPSETYLSQSCCRFHSLPAVSGHCLHAGMHCALCRMTPHTALNCSCSFLPPVDQLQELSRQEEITLQDDAACTDRFTLESDVIENDSLNLECGVASENEQQVTAYPANDLGHNADSENTRSASSTLSQELPSENNLVIEPLLEHLLHSDVDDSDSDIFPIKRTLATRRNNATRTSGTVGDSKNRTSGPVVISMNRASNTVKNGRNQVAFATDISKKRIAKGALCDTYDSSRREACDTEDFEEEHLAVSNTMFDTQMAVRKTAGKKQTLSRAMTKMRNRTDSEKISEVSERVNVKNKLRGKSKNSDQVLAATAENIKRATSGIETSLQSDGSKDMPAGRRALVFETSDSVNKAGADVELAESTTEEEDLMSCSVISKGVEDYTLLVDLGVSEMFPRSKRGRLLIPTLQYWHRECVQVVGDKLMFSTSDTTGGRNEDWNQKMTASMKLINNLRQQVGVSLQRNDESVIQSSQVVESPVKSSSGSDRKRNMKSVMPEMSTKRSGTQLQSPMKSNTEWKKNDAEKKKQARKHDDEKSKDRKKLSSPIKGMVLHGAKQRKTRSEHVSQLNSREIESHQLTVRKASRGRQAGLESGGNVPLLGSPTNRNEDDRRKNNRTRFCSYNDRLMFPAEIAENSSGRQLRLRKRNTEDSSNNRNAQPGRELRSKPKKDGSGSGKASYKKKMQADIDKMSLQGEKPGKENKRMVNASVKSMLIPERKRGRKLPAKKSRKAANLANLSEKIVETLSQKSKISQSIVEKKNKNNTKFTAVLTKHGKPELKINVKNTTSKTTGKGRESTVAKSSKRHKTLERKSPSSTIQKRRKRFTRHSKFEAVQPFTKQSAEDFKDDLFDHRISVRDSKTSYKEVGKVSHWGKRHADKNERMDQLFEIKAQKKESIQANFGDLKKNDHSFNLELNNATITTKKQGGKKREQSYQKKGLKMGQVLTEPHAGADSGKAVITSQLLKKPARKRMGQPGVETTEEFHAELPTRLRGKVWTVKDRRRVTNFLHQHNAGAEDDLFDNNILRKETGTGALLNFWDEDSSDGDDFSIKTPTSKDGAFRAITPISHYVDLSAQHEKTPTFDSDPTETRILMNDPNTEAYINKKLKQQSKSSRTLLSSKPEAAADNQKRNAIPSDEGNTEQGSINFLDLISYQVTCNSGDEGDEKDVYFMDTDSE